MEGAASARKQAIGLLLAATIVLTAFGSSSVAQLDAIGQRGRWVALVVVAAVACWQALTLRDQAPRPLLLPWALAAVFVGLGLASAGWSVDPHLTVGRIGSLAILLLAAGGLARGRTRAIDAARDVMRACLLGSIGVAVASLGLLLVSRHDAILSATTGAGWRFRGIGENPNTVPMLLAASLPLAVWWLLGARGRMRVAAAASVLVFAVEIALSGSRGALIAGFGGAAFTALLLLRPARQKVAAALVLVLAAGACANADAVQGSGRVSETSVASDAAPLETHRTFGIDAEQLFRLEDELGHPPLGTYRPPVRRTLFGSSGRAEAWAEAVSQGRSRPALGYGFGTEDHVFVDRSYAFEGGLVENTYIGVLLQLGLVGLTTLVALLATLGWAALRARRNGSHTGDAAAGAGGVLVAAALLGLSQSGLVAVGNVAATTVWTCALLLPSLAAGARA